MTRPLWLRVYRWLCPWPCRFWKRKRLTRSRRAILLWAELGLIRNANNLGSKAPENEEIP